MTNQLLKVGFSSATIGLVIGGVFGGIGWAITFQLAVNAFVLFNLFGSANPDPHMAAPPSRPHHRVQFRVHDYYLRPPGTPGVNPSRGGRTPRGGGPSSPRRGGLLSPRRGGPSTPRRRRHNNLEA